LLKYLKTIRSHTGHAQFLRDTKDTGTWLARVQAAEIQTPFRSSPVIQVLQWKTWKVAIFETAHKTFKVYEVPEDTRRFETEKEAEDFHIACTSIGQSDTEWAKKNGQPSKE